METKTKTFDAVAESRKWREAASQKLNAMSRVERLAYLKNLGERVRAEMRARQIAQPAARALASFPPAVSIDPFSRAK